jgi:V8-like Glu-specific endopeptidase
MQPLRLPQTGPNPPRLSHQAMPQNIRAALAAPAMLALLLCLAARCAAQAQEDAAVATPGDQQPAQSPPSKVTAAPAVHRRPFTRAAMRRAVKERALQLTREQAAAVFQAASSSASEPEAAGAEAAASYAPETGGVVPLSQVRLGGGVAACRTTQRQSGVANSRGAGRARAPPRSAAPRLARLRKPPAPCQTPNRKAPPAPAADRAPPAPAARGRQGTSGFSFSDTRVAKSGTALNPVFKPAGKLYFRDGPDAYLCSASLIGKSLLVTAGHQGWGRACRFAAACRARAPRGPVKRCAHVATVGSAADGADLLGKRCVSTGRVSPTPAGHCVTDGAGGWYTDHTFIVSGFSQAGARLARVGYVAAAGRAAGRPAANQQTLGGRRQAASAHSNHLPIPRAPFQMLTRRSRPFHPSLTTMLTPPQPTWHSRPSAWWRPPNTTWCGLGSGAGGRGRARAGAAIFFWIGWDRMGFAFPAAHAASRKSSPSGAHWRCS